MVGQGASWTITSSYPSCSRKVDSAFCRTYSKLHTVKTVEPTQAAHHLFLSLMQIKQALWQTTCAGGHPHFACMHMQTSSAGNIRHDDTADDSQDVHEG